MHVNDDPLNDFIHEPQAVLSAVKEFAQRANIRRTSCIPAVLEMLDKGGVRPAPHVNGGNNSSWKEQMLPDGVFLDTLRQCRTKQEVGNDGWRCILLRWAPE